MNLRPQSLICPECSKLGIRSQVRYDGATKTLLSWSEGHYDESGRWIEHNDPNTYTAGFHCTEGHWITIKYRKGEGEIERESGVIKR